ncbi:MAG: hypothetical protein FWE41_04600 [Coriobacteriia bacterium]|nr:hypothetical protein [Coriobacteriia bacterium]MCL2750770.1 hypothetical protein [Coriobacteriia bacterium]
MGFTIYYKGTLAEGKAPSDVFDAVSDAIKETSWPLVIEGDTAYIDFPGDMIAEPIGFDLTSRSMEGMSKLIFSEPEEFYTLFNLFYAISPLFDDYEVSDDFNAWPEFLAEKQNNA